MFPSEEIVLKQLFDWSIATNCDNGLDVHQPKCQTFSGYTCLFLFYIIVKQYEDTTLGIFYNCMIHYRLNDPSINQKKMINRLTCNENDRLLRPYYETCDECKDDGNALQC